MAEPKENVLMEKIVSLCKRRGFIFQSSEIYGGIGGFWDYGPLGAELKRNVKELWWNTMTRQREDVVGLEATIVMHPQIWKASGHTDTFADMMRECPHTKKRIRADQVEPRSGMAYTFLGAFGDPKDGLPYRSENPDVSRQTIGDYVSEEKPTSFNEISLSKLAVYAEARLKPLNLQRSPEELGQLAHMLADMINRYLCREPIRVLVPPGKPAESALKSAAEFYEKTLGVRNPLPLGWQTEKLEGSMEFHPESGFGLGPARPFNLMFKTYVGPVDVPQPDFDPESVAPKELQAWRQRFDESQKNIAYLRPETAQAIFAQFKNVLDSSRQKVPFGIAQIGKAFRNEVTPRNFTFRSREFEQMELEFFIKPDEAVGAITGSVATPSSKGHPGEPQPNWGWQLWHQYWVEERIKFYEGIGLPRTTLEEYWQKPEELAHYAKATVDILFKFPFGTQELEGIAARSDFDLSQHERCSGKPMGVFDEELRTAWGKLDKTKQDDLWRSYTESRKKYLVKMGVEPEQASKEAREDADGLAKGQYIPHVIEPSAGVDRLILALIANAYHEDQMPDEKGKMETRVLMKFHPRVAPIKVAVLPLLKNKPDLVKKAREVYELLRAQMNTFYDDAGAIGRRYRRQDEAGTPFCVTVDFETFEGMKEGPLAGQTDTVTVRHRDDGRQERFPVTGLLAWLLERVR